MAHQPRSSQKPILAYQGGRMGVSAVPGSGKTWTLSQLAIQLLQREVLAEDQELLIVTLTNSAANHFKAQLDAWTRENRSSGLIPSYHVCTLHSLAYNILRERPSLANLDPNFTILDEHTCNELLTRISNQVAKSFSPQIEPHLKESLSESQGLKIKSTQLPTLIAEIGLQFIRTAKDKRLIYEQIQQHVQYSGLGSLWMKIGLEVYWEYQLALAHYGGIDFDDLIRLAVDVLEQNEDYLAHLQNRWPYVLEDEAQDSSRLQEVILRKLTAAHGNWVRVGDPNQAIYETFTTANPKYLKNFLREEGVTACNLDESSRSCQAIINLANYLIEWTRSEHPCEEVRDALTPPHICPVPSSDPHPNPPSTPDAIKIVLDKAFTPQKEINAVAFSLEQWLPKNPDKSVAVLAFSNAHAEKLIDELERRAIPFSDQLLKSNRRTHPVTKLIHQLLEVLLHPLISQHYAQLFSLIHSFENQTQTENIQINRLTQLLQRCSNIEAFVYPAKDNDWLDSVMLLDQSDKELLLSYRSQLQRWLNLNSLPIDQQIISFASEVFVEPRHLAMAHKLAFQLRRSLDLSSQKDEAFIIDTFREIIRNKENFLIFEDSQSFDPSSFPGKVVVGTIHKAKGLEWDRVYVMSVNNYDFPSGLPGDPFRNDIWYLKENINPAAAALAALDQVVSRDEYEEESVSPDQAARLDLIRERLRLLYVAITRAKRELILTWNTGKNNDLKAAEPLKALYSYWQSTKNQ